MFELNLNSASAYLADRGIGGIRSSEIYELGGGVSNTVLLVQSGGRRFVLKQALARLRVQEEWLSDPARALRECHAMKALAPQLPTGAVPEILFVDEKNCLFAMAAAPDGAQPWKSLLLSGDIRESVAASISQLLVSSIRATWLAPEWEHGFGDQHIFDELRLDPYYRFTASRHPDLASQFASLIEDCRTRRVSIVHGDWSPKNFLVVGDDVTVIDYEVTHYGNPAFDTAFLLNHLLLKSHFRPQWKNQYRAAALCFWKQLRSAVPAQASWMEASTIRHLGGLHLARIDGKSPAEYITDPGMKESIRAFARRLILHPPETMEEVFE